MDLGILNLQNSFYKDFFFKGSHERKKEVKTDEV